jgi:hypothetical protein
MTTIRIAVVASPKVGITTFLDSLPYPHVKVPAPYELLDRAPRYYALPTGDLLEVTINPVFLYDRDGVLIMWRESVSGSESRARADYKLIGYRSMLIENTDKNTTQEKGEETAFSFRDGRECARVLMLLVEKIRRV